jgi:hypothetical protein
LKLNFSIQALEKKVVFLLTLITEKKVLPCQPQRSTGRAEAVSWLMALPMLSGCAGATIGSYLHKLRNTAKTKALKAGDREARHIVMC